MSELTHSDFISIMAHTSSGLDSYDMVWLLNVHVNQVDAYIKHITKGNKRIIFKNYPRATQVYTTAQLEEMGLVGVYERIEKK